MNDDNRGKIVLMSFGLGGNSYHYENPNTTGSWYAKPEDVTAPWWEEHYPSATMEGCILLDKIPALESEGGFSLAFKSPMCRSDIEAGKRDEFAQRLQGREWFAGALASEVPQFAAFLALRAAHDDATEPGPLDYVSIPEYVAWWARHGARVGVVKNGRAIWQEAQA